MAYGVLLRQHKPKWGQLVHKVRSGHFLYVVWVIVAWFVVEFYESNLKASLMIKSYEPNIESLWELIER